MAEADLYREYKIENKIYNSPYAETVWTWLKSGMPVAAVVSSLRALSQEEDNIPLTVTEPTVRAFKRIMEDLELKHVGKEFGVGVGESERMVTQNDLVLCDLAIAKGLKDLRGGDTPVALSLVLQFMQFKQKVMGDKYQGQGLVDLLDVTRQFYELLDAVAIHCDKPTYTAIFNDLKKRGWSEEESGEELRVKRKVAASSIAHDLDLDGAYGGERNV